jgi:hypothetical protein
MAQINDHVSSEYVIDISNGNALRNVPYDYQMGINNVWTIVTM